MEKLPLTRLVCSKIKAILVASANKTWINFPTVLLLFFLKGFNAEAFYYRNHCGAEPGAEWSLCAYINNSLRLELISSPTQNRPTIKTEHCYEHIRVKNKQSSRKVIFLIPVSLISEAKWGGAVCLTHYYFLNFSRITFRENNITAG